MLKNLRNSLRLIRIGFTLARYDALFLLDGANLPFLPLIPYRLFRRRKLPARPGQRLAAALGALGPTFIKLGQTLSIRSDIVGEEIAEDLAQLRDNLPAFPTAQAQAIIEEELGASLSSLFNTFDEAPIAAASIAQVHFATLRNGEEVAVKILRPGVEEAFASDISLFFWLAEIAERNLPATRRLKPVEVVKTFRETVAFELDLRLEAAAATELRENIAKDDGFTVPAINWHLTARRVMTMQRISGIPIGEVEALRAAGHDMQKLVERIANGFFNQTFRDGFFHADLHPGNLFVQTDGTIAAVDFGIMGRIDKRNRIYVAEILRGFLNGDFRHVAEVHFTAGYVPADQSVDNFALACMAIAKPILDKPLNEVSAGRLLGQLFKVTETFQMETQPQLLLLQKSLVLIEGLGRLLTPQLNMWQLSQPLIERWAIENLGPQARIKEGLTELLTTARKLPEWMRETHETLERLKTGVRLHPESLHHLSLSRKRIHYQWMAFAWAVLAAGVAAMILK